MTPLRIFIGYDESEAVAYHVLCRSILRRASAPVSFSPIVRSHLGTVYTRERGPLESTDFSITRFLVPWLSGYEGVSIYMDCDFLCLADIHEFPWNEGAVVSVCKHDYVPKSATKFGKTQTTYPRKNWSSLMVFNNSRCQALTPEYVNSASGLALHRFEWADRHEDGCRAMGTLQGAELGCDCAGERIGSIPLEWNWLVGEYEPNPDAKMLHFTLGGPWQNVASEEGQVWTTEYREMTGTQTAQMVR